MVIQLPPNQSQPILPNYFKMSLNYKNKKGFSVLEMVVYVVILSIIFVIVVNTLLVIVRSYSFVKVSIDINSSATISMERMVQEIRRSLSIDDTLTILDSNPGRLVLNSTDSMGTPTTFDFYLDSGSLKLDQGGVLTGSLTKDNATVSNLIFRKITTGESEAIKIEMQIDASSGNTSKSEAFQNTAVLRGSY